MPFRSKSQQRLLFATRPRLARRWAHHTDDIKSLPEKVKKKRKKSASLPDSAGLAKLALLGNAGQGMLAGMSSLPLMGPGAPQLQLPPAQPLQPGAAAKKPVAPVAPAPPALQKLASEDPALYEMLRSCAEADVPIAVVERLLRKEAGWEALGKAWPAVKGVGLSAGRWAKGLLPSAKAVAPAAVHEAPAAAQEAAALGRQAARIPQPGFPAPLGAAAEAAAPAAPALTKAPTQFRSPLSQLSHPYTAGQEKALVDATRSLHGLPEVPINQLRLARGIDHASNFGLSAIGDNLGGLARGAGKAIGDAIGGVGSPGTWGGLAARGAGSVARGTGELVGHLTSGAFRFPGQIPRLALGMNTLSPISRFVANVGNAPMASRVQQAGLGTAGAAGLSWLSGVPGHHARLQDDTRAELNELGESGPRQARDVASAALTLDLPRAGRALRNYGSQAYDFGIDMGKRLYNVGQQRSLEVYEGREPRGGGNSPAAPLGPPEPPPGRSPSGDSIPDAAGLGVLAARQQPPAPAPAPAPAQSPISGSNLAASSATGLGGKLLSVQQAQAHLANATPEQVQQAQAALPGMAENLQKFTQDPELQKQLAAYDQDPASIQMTPQLQEALATRTQAADNVAVAAWPNVSDLVGGDPSKLPAALSDPDPQAPVRARVAQMIAEQAQAQGQPLSMESVWKAVSSMKEGPMLGVLAGVGLGLIGLFSGSWLLAGGGILAALFAAYMGGGLDPFKSLLPGAAGGATGPPGPPRPPGASAAAGAAGLGALRVPGAPGGPPTSADVQWSADLGRAAAQIATKQPGFPQTDNPAEVMAWQAKYQPAERVASLRELDKLVPGSLQRIAKGTQDRIDAGLRDAGRLSFAAPLRSDYRSGQQLLQDIQQAGGR